MSYFKIYNPRRVNSDGEPCCNHCAAYPELFHAMPYTGHLKDWAEVNRQLKHYPDGVVIEFHTVGNTFICGAYTNHTTRTQWKHNGTKWAPQTKKKED